MKSPKIICLYYHRISPVKENLSIPPEIFQSQLEALLDEGYRAISISSLIDFLSGKPLDVEKPIMLSFDDGYLDFYFYVFPLLQKYKMNAIAFLVTDWMNEEGGANSSSQIPVELSNINGDQAVKSALQGDRRLFLSWPLAKEMAESGLVEFGSHSVSHRLGFRSAKIARFILGNEAHWKYAQAYDGNVKAGLPIFKKASALAIRRFLPNKEALEQLTGHCSTRLPISANNQKQVEAELRQLAGKIASWGNYEPEKDARERIFSELKNSKSIIEKRLGLSCPSLSWPFGDYSELSISLARQAGYKIGFTIERGAIGQDTEPFSLRRFAVEAIPGPKLVRELGTLQNRLLNRIINGRPRSRKVIQNI